MSRKLARPFAIMVVLAMLLALVPTSLAAGQQPPASLKVTTKAGRTMSVQELMDMGNVNTTSNANPGKGGEYIQTTAIPVAYPEIEMIPANVFPVDGRRHVVWGAHRFPNLAITYIELAWPDGVTHSTCTGWFFGPRVVATAAHCLYNADYGGFADATVYAGVSSFLNDDLVWYGIVPVFGFGKVKTPAVTTDRNMIVPTDYVTADQAGLYDPVADYGIIQLNDIVVDGDTWGMGWWTGWLGFRGKFHLLTNGAWVIPTDVPDDPTLPIGDWMRFPNQLFKGKFWTIGYPTDYILMAQTKQSNDKAIWVSDWDALYHYLDMHSGQGGSPLYQDYKYTFCDDAFWSWDAGTSEWWRGDIQPCVVAIQTSGSSRTSLNPAGVGYYRQTWYTDWKGRLYLVDEPANRARRITPEVFMFLLAFKDPEGEIPYDPMQ